MKKTYSPNVAEAKSAKQSGIISNDPRDIVRDAYVYGFPLVDNYRILYSYFVDKNNPEYKTSWNELYNTARVYTPDDKAVQSPNSDTPYSFVGADLRAEPLVFTVPAIEKDRYYSLQFIDCYTFNFAYVGTRTSGNDGGNYLLTGPNWKGERPAGIKGMISCETEFALVLYRTQLFNPGDIENVKKIQAGYKVQALSKFLNKPTPAAAPTIDFRKPLGAKEQRNSLEFFNILNFVLQFCPTHPSEKEMMERFARIGIGAGRTIDVDKLTPGIEEAMQGGITDAWKIYEEVRKLGNKGQISSGDVFGSREYLGDNYAYRFEAAADGIYGNSKEEASYPVYFVDANGDKMDGSKNKYQLHFASGQLPPVNAFWSLTLYELPASLLSANPLNRFLINSSMLPDLKKDADGSITLYIQHDTPGKDKKSNWHPAPAGPFFCALRLYYPKKEGYDGTWKKPAMQRISGE